MDDKTLNFQLELQNQKIDSIRKEFACKQANQDIRAEALNNTGKHLNYLMLFMSLVFTILALSSGYFVVDSQQTTQKIKEDIDEIVKDININEVIVKAIKKQSDKKYKEAAKLWEQIVTSKKIISDDSLHVSHHNLGICYSELNKFDQAIDQYKKAIKLQPDDLYSYLNLFEMFLITNKDFDPEIVKNFRKKFIKLPKNQNSSLSKNTSTISFPNYAQIYYHAFKLLLDVNKNVKLTDKHKETFKKKYKPYKEYYTNPEFYWDWTYIEKWINESNNKTELNKLLHFLKEFL